MKNIGLILLIALSLIQHNCSIKQQKLDGLWFYTHTSGNEYEENIEISPASFLNLQKDGSYTRDFGTFDYGNWTRKDTVLVLNSINGKIFEFSIRTLFENELKLRSGKGTIINFENQPDKFPSVDADPFSVNNNHWRIPAKHKETEIEIKNRLKNHFRFNEMYIKWAINYQFTTLDIGSTPSPLKIYGNGFALKDYNELPVAWKSYFFDEEDCKKANAIIKDIFDNKDIAWAKTENRFKMFVSAFQQLQQFLK